MRSEESVPTRLFGDDEVGLEEQVESCQLSPAQNLTAGNIDLIIDLIGQFVENSSNSIPASCVDLISFDSPAPAP